MNQIKIEIHYIAHINENDFKSLLKHAEDLGYDFNDAGKMETVRRYLQSEGTAEVDNLVRGCNSVLIERIS